MNRLLFVFGFFSCFISIVFSSTWRDCGSATGKVIKLEVDGCKNRHRCLLKRGFNVSLHITLEPNQFIRKAHADVYGVIRGLPVPYAVAKKDACRYKLMTCPAFPHKQYVYKNVLFVEKAYPKISLVVKWTLKDQTNRNLVCLLIPVKIIDP